MAKCLNTSEIELLLDGAVPLDEQAEAHLAECSNCREAINSHRENDELFLQIKLAFLENNYHSGPKLESACRSDLEVPPENIEPIEGYQILSEIHRGGQGVVYRAVQKATKRTVALKLLLQGPYASPRQRSRFEREIDLVATLKHPNIVTVYDSGLSHGRLFYAMEFVQGNPLDQFMQSIGTRGPGPGGGPPELPLPDTLRLFHKICAAVGYAQQRGVIHRDLKPANILVDSAGEPHVLDFGLAKTIADDASSGQLTETGEFLGTLAYASPEQASADPQKIDVRSDVYSLGVILFEMLTGSFPYPVMGPLSDVLRQIIDTTPRRPSTARRDVDAEIDSITLMALAKEPERRYQSADHLARDIERYLDREPIDAKRDSTWYVLRKLLRRHRTVVVTVTAFCVVIASAFVLSVHLWRRAAADRDIARNAESNEKTARIAEKKQREEAEFQAYVANVAAADQSLRSHDIVDARQRLQRAPQRLRNWEWFHLHQRLDSSRQTLVGHSKYVINVVFSPDGEWIASVDMNGAVRIWNVRNGEYLREFQTVLSATWVEFSPDGQLLAVGEKGGSVSLWNTSDGRKEAELVGPPSLIRGIAFSADGQRLASAHGNIASSSAPVGSLIVWNVASRTPAITLPAPSFIGDVSFHPDPSKIAVMALRQIELWDATTGEVLQTLSGHGSVASAIEFSPDGMQLVSGWNDGSIRVWDTQSGDEVARYSGHTGPVRDISFNHDGSRLVTGSRDKTIRLWDAISGTPLAVFCGHTWAVTSVAFSPCGKKVASASWDTTAKIWNATELDEVTTLRGHTQHASGIAINSAGTRIASSSWDKTVRLWDATTLKPLATFNGHDGQVQCVAINSAPGSTRWLASGSWDQTIRLWNPDSPEDVRILRGHTDRVQGLAFSPDGKLLVSGSRDNTIRFWDAASGEPAGMLGGHTDHIHCVAFSPNGRILASSGHETIRLWDVETRAPVASLPRTIVQEDYSLVFHPEGRHLVAGSDLRMLFVWELDRLEPVVRLPNHTDEINSVAFTSDGTRLASASFDGTVRIWDVETWTEVTTLSGYSGRVNTIVFSPDDKWLIGGLSDGTIKVWESGERKSGN